MNRILTNITRHILQLCSIVIVSIALSGCSGEMCMEPDDFGFATATISSRYDPINGNVRIFGPQTSEITPWMDNNLILDGNVVYIEVQNWIPGVDPNDGTSLSAWCPWYGSAGQGNVLGNFCARLDPCNFLGEQNCYDADWNFTSDSCVKAAYCPTHPIPANAQITNAPCLMTKGVGLYALISMQQYSPNLSIDSMSNPDTTQTINLHVGDPHVGYVIPAMDSSGNMENAGGLLYDYDGNHTSNSDRLSYVNGKLYFKILDHFYEDNNGQYKVVIKSGVLNGGWDPISWCISLVQTALFGTGGGNIDYTSSGIIPEIYSAVVANSSFVDTVRAALVLFVIISAIGFTIGSIELTQKELLNRIYNVIIMVALISPSSWDFFNRHVFIWFYQGTNFVINILYQVAASGPGSSNPLDFFFSYQIFMKLFSLLFSSPTGWIFIIVYLIMLVYIVKIFFDAAVLYMTSLIMMGVLISIAPVFIMLLLFEQTKSFFDNWVKQLTAYAIQMILVYAGILFMTMLIRNQIYNTLGFPLCSIVFPNVPGIPTLFQLYFPQIASSNPASGPSVIPVPKDHFQTAVDAAINVTGVSSAKSSITTTGNQSAIPFGFTSTSDPNFCLQNPTSPQCTDADNPNILSTSITDPNAGAFCSAYECLGYRYLDLPFLDPNDSYESTLINQIRAGYIGDFGGLAIIVVCVFLLDYFNKNTVSLSKGLSDTVNNSGNAADAAASASASFHAAAISAVKFADKHTLGVGKKVQGARDKVHDFFSKKKHGLIDKPWNDHKTKSLKNDALKEQSLIGGNLKSVTRSAESTSGIKHSEALTFKNNVKNGAYASDLANAIKQSGAVSAATSTSGSVPGAREAVGATNLSSGTGAKSPTLNAQNSANNILQKLGKGSAADFNNIASQELFNGKTYDALSASQKKAIDNLAANSGVASILSSKQQQETFQNAYVDSYNKMSDEGRGFLQKRSSLLRGYTDLKAEVNANIRQDQEDRLLRREKFDSLFGGSVRGDQIRYDNDGLRTNNELLASKESAKTYRNLSNSINKETLNAGRDIQRADFETTVLQKELIKEYVTASTKEALQSELSGEKYIKTRMNDKSLKALIDKVRLKGQNILDSDEYLKDSGLYAGNNLAMQKLAEREQMIRNVVDDTINHINDIRESRGMPPYVGHSEQDSYVFGKDMTNIIEVKQKDYSIDASFQQQQDATPVPDKHDKFKLTEADVKPEAHSKPESSVSHRSSGSEESTTQESSSNSSESSDDGSSRTPNKKPDNDSASSSSSSSNATKPKR